jgi:hypothetical protein
MINLERPLATMGRYNIAQVSRDTILCATVLIVYELVK